MSLFFKHSKILAENFGKLRLSFKFQVSMHLLYQFGWIVQALVKPFFYITVSEFESFFPLQKHSQFLSDTSI